MLKKITLIVCIWFPLMAWADYYRDGEGNLWHFVGGYAEPMFVEGYSYAMACHMNVSCPPSNIPSGYTFDISALKEGSLWIYYHCPIRPSAGMPEEDRIHFSYMPGQGAACDYIQRVCPPGKRWFAHPELGVSEGRCEAPYKLVVPPYTTPNSCSSNVLNPIDVSLGSKIQTEPDIASEGVGQVEFSRTYNNSNVQIAPVWQHNYSRVLSAIDSTTIGQFNLKNTEGYAEKYDACLSGWNELKVKIVEDWALNSSAVYDGGDACKIYRNGLLVRTLPIINESLDAESNIPVAVQLFREDGGVIVFKYVRGMGYVSITGNLGKLEYIKNSPVRWRFTSPANYVEEYSINGKLLSITAHNGVKQTLSYDPATGYLTNVQDSLGKRIALTYVNSALENVKIDNKVTHYQFNQNELLVKVTRPDNTLRIYHYEDSRFPKHLTGITDERGVRYATWTYDSNGRAITSTHAGGADAGTINYNSNGTVTLTNSLNKQTVYSFTEISGARRVASIEGHPTASCAGANQNYTYTEEGWLASKTDWKGVKTTYQYNTKGQETSRTEAYGTPVAKTITTEWHPTLNLKTKVAEPGVETTYNYDANGLLLNQKTRSLVTQ